MRVDESGAAAVTVIDFQGKFQRLKAINKQFA